MKKRMATICLAVALAVGVGIIAPLALAGDPPYIMVMPTK